MHVLDTEPTILAVKNCSKNKSSQKRRRTFNDYSLLTKKGVFMDSSRRSYSNIESDMWELLPAWEGRHTVVASSSTSSVSFET